MSCCVSVCHCSPLSYDHFRGVVSLVRIFSGSIKKGDKVRFLQADRKYDVLEVGVHSPEEVPVDILKDGQVGYVVCNMKNSEEGEAAPLGRLIGVDTSSAFIGDTICLADKLVDPLSGFKPMKAMVYAGIFPVDSGDFPKLEEAIERVSLVYLRAERADRFSLLSMIEVVCVSQSIRLASSLAVSVQRESSAALAQGFRLGFLGTLHMDVLSVNQSASEYT